MKMTFFEKSVATLIGAILLAVLLLNMFATENPDLLVREVCVAGYKHLVTGNGQLQQVLDSDGHGISCSKRKAG